YPINESGAILRINDRQKGHHGCNRPCALRIPDRPHAWQSSNISWTFCHESLRGNVAREPGPALDRANDPLYFRRFTHLGFDSTFSNQTRGAPRRLCEAREREFELGITDDDAERSD